MLKMTKDDWIFLISYMVGILILAVILDLVLHLIDGKFIVLPGVMIGSGLLRNRILAREQKKK